jgi:glycosyltransferase involved in cell wall biosynthesis
MGLFELIEAMTRLPSNIRLDIGGEGPLRAALEGCVQALGLRRRILLHGHIPDDELPGFYSSADWFVLPTVTQEGFGLVILESLSCGTPVLGTRIGAIPELLERIDPEWLIPEPSAESIAATVLSALKRPVPDRNDLHQRIAKEFDWDRIAEQYDRLFRSLV